MLSVVNLPLQPLASVSALYLPACLDLGVPEGDGLVEGSTTLLGDGRGWSRGELGLLLGDDEAALLTAGVGGDIGGVGSGDLSTSNRVLRSKGRENLRFKMGLSGKSYL